MKVSGAGGTSSVSSGPGPKRVAGKAMSLPQTNEATGAAPAARASSASAVGGLDALLALQEAGGPLERRRRAVRRAGKILDGLEQVKMALLDSASPAPALTALAAVVKEVRAETDDPMLEDVLNEVDVRAAVELAKREVAEARAREGV
ncbi:MAG: flagellar assembly protein FliX [Pseudomonadota bacterium]|jgi:hypothetical protein